MRSQDGGSPEAGARLARVPLGGGNACLSFVCWRVAAVRQPQAGSCVLLHFDGRAWVLGVLYWVTCACVRALNGTEGGRADTAGEGLSAFVNARRFC